MAGKVCPSRTRRRLSALPDRFHASPSCCWLDHRVRRATPGPSRCMGVRVDRRFERPGNIRCGCAAASRKNGGMGIRLAWSVAIHAPGVASSGTWSPGQALRTGGRDMIAGGPWHGRVGACRRFTIFRWDRPPGLSGKMAAPGLLCPMPSLPATTGSPTSSPCPCPVRSRPRRRRPDRRLRVRHHDGAARLPPLFPCPATKSRRWRRAGSATALCSGDPRPQGLAGMVTASTARHDPETGHAGIIRGYM